MPQQYDPIMDFYRRNAGYQDRPPSFGGGGAQGGGGASGYWDSPMITLPGTDIRLRLDMLDELIRASEQGVDLPGAGESMAGPEERTAMGGTKRMQRPDESDMYGEAPKRKAMSAEFTGYSTPLDAWLHSKSESVDLSQLLSPVERGEGEYATGLDEWLHGLSSPDSGSSAEEAAAMHDAAQARFAEVDEKSASDEAKQVILDAKERSDLKKQTQQDSLDSMLDIPDRSKSIIRAEAMAAGRAGGLGTGARPTFDDYAAAFDGTSTTGGGFSQAEMTPELAARNADTEQWLGRQPERDLAYAMTPEMARRDPEYAADAAARLPAMQQQRRLASRQANTDKMIDSITGSSGLIDPKNVEKLQLLDPSITIPSNRIGVSTEQATAAMQNELNVLYNMASKLSAEGIIDGDNRIVAANRLASEIQKSLMQLSKPGHDPNAVLAEYRVLVSKIRMELMPQGEAPVGGHKWEEVE